MHKDIEPSDPALPTEDTSNQLEPNTFDNEARRLSNNPTLCKNPSHRQLKFFIEISKNFLQNP